MRSRWIIAVEKVITQIYPDFNPNDETSRVRLLKDDAYLVGVRDSSRTDLLLWLTCPQKTSSGKKARFHAKAILTIIWDHLYEPSTGLTRQSAAAKYFETVPP